MDDRRQRTEGDFHTMTLEEIQGLTGLEPPADAGPEDERRYRERAYESYMLDVAHAHQWGTAREGDYGPPTTREGDEEPAGDAEER